MKLKAVKAWLKLWLMTAMLISSLNSVHVAVATTSSAGSDSVDITDLAVELEGYNGVRYTFTYDEWRAYLESINIPHGDNYMDLGQNIKGPLPKNFLLLEYTNTQSGKIVDVEIYEYDSAENATREFDIQNDQYHGPWGLIFQRFIAVQVLLHRGQFMVFSWCVSEDPEGDRLAQSILTDCTQKFVDNLFNVLPGSTQPSPPPSVNFAGEVVWGVKPGDTMSWQYNWTTFTGYVGGGMSSGGGSRNITMEIIQITDDNLAILIKSPVSHPLDFEYVGIEGISEWTGKPVPMGLDLVLPPYSYFWATVTDPVKDPYGEAGTLIIPIYSEGQTLKDAFDPKFDITEGAEYITGHYKTAPEEYTPTETQWEDFTVHKGSGIVTKESFYYNSNYYSITTSHSFTLKNTNFDLSSRVPYTPEQGEIPSEYTLSVLETTKNSIRISWTASTDDRFAKYEIYQSTSSGDLGTKINTITDRSTTSYTIPGLSANTTYYFTVKVVYTDSSSTDYNQVSGTTKSSATSPTTQFPLPLLAGAAVAVVATVIVVAAIFLKRRKSLAPQPSEHPTKSSQPPPPSSIEVAQPKEKGVHGISATEEEQLLGGLTSGDLHLKGKVSFGYGIYVTNKRIIGVKSMKGLLASGLLGLAGLWVGRTDSSAKAIAELEEKKDIEVRKEDVSEIEMKKPHGIRAGYLNIALNSGGSVTVLIGNKKEFEPIKNLMAAFRPEVLKAEE